MYTSDMAPAPRLTRPSYKVLSYMVQAPSNEHYGFELMDACGLSSATTYRTLARFRDAGWLEWRVEAVDPAEVGRPARTYYRLSPDGALMARGALDELGLAGNAAGAVA